MLMYLQCRICIYERIYRKWKMHLKFLVRVFHKPHVSNNNNHNKWYVSMWHRYTQTHIRTQLAEWEKMKIKNRTACMNSRKQHKRHVIDNDVIGHSVPIVFFRSFPCFSSFSSFSQSFTPFFPRAPDCFKRSNRSHTCHFTNDNRFRISVILARIFFICCGSCQLQ